MTRSPIALAAALLALGAPLPARAQNDADPRAIARAFDDAQQTGDGAALDRLLAPDFLFVRADGHVGDRRDFIAGFTAPGHSLEPFRIVDPLFIRAGADVAIVGGEAWVSGIEGGRRITHHFRYSDTLAKRDGRWVVIYAQVTGLPAG